MQVIGAGVVTETAMSLMDEALTPAIRASAPSRDCPTLTRVRSLANHLIYGAVVALTAEALYRLVGTEPVPSGRGTAALSPRGDYKDRPTGDRQLMNGTEWASVDDRAFRLRPDVPRLDARVYASACQSIEHHLDSGAA